MSRVRPSEVYKQQTRAEVLERVRSQGYKVVAFRPPVYGEYFLPVADHLKPEILTFPWVKFYVERPRLILERKTLAERLPQ